MASEKNTDLSGKKGSTGCLAALQNFLKENMNAAAGKLKVDETHDL